MTLIYSSREEREFRGSLVLRNRHAGFWGGIKPNPHHYVCGVRYPSIRWYWKALYWGPRVLILVPTENFCPRMSNAHHLRICGGGRSSGTRKQNLWCVGERISSTVACFETGGLYSLTCYRRLCISKPNAYGERGTSESESDSKSRSLQTCKHLEGTPEGADDFKMSQSQQSRNDSKNAARPRSVERVEGNYHEEQRLGYKPAPAKGRKTFKAKCGLLHTFGPPCTARPTVDKCAAPLGRGPTQLGCPLGTKASTPSRAFRVVTLGSNARPDWCPKGTPIGLGRSASNLRRTTLRSIHSIGQPDPLGRALRDFAQEVQKATSEGRRRPQSEVNGSHIMTLSPPQLKVASVSSTSYGLTKLAELKRHRAFHARLPPLFILWKTGWCRSANVPPNREKLTSWRRRRDDDATTRRRRHDDDTTTSRRRHDDEAAKQSEHRSNPRPQL